MSVFAHLKYIFLIWCSILLSCQRGWGQGAKLSDFRFEHLTVDQGLSHSDAMAVTQDHDGFIWVGTNRGINRYDGYRLRHYILPINSRNGLSDNRIKVLLTDSSGRLWVGGDRSGLLFYDRSHDAFVSFDEHFAPAAYRRVAQQLAQGNITALAIDKQHRLWVGTYQYGLFRLTFDQQGHLTDLYQRADLLCITGLAADAEGKIWVGTSQTGLQVVQAAAPALPLPDTGLRTTIWALHLDHRGDLWVGTDQQVLWLPPANRRALHQLAAHPLPVSLPRVMSLRLDSFGRLWVGTSYGLYVWPAAARTQSAPPLLGPPTLFLPQDGAPFSLRSERILQVFEGHNQLMWLCTSAGGLNKVDLRQKPFGQLRRQLTSSFMLANNYVNAIYKEEATNTLWYGTRNGVAAYDLTRHTYQSYLDQPTAVARGVDVADVFQAADGALWFGTRNNGFAILRRPQRGPAHLTHYVQLPDGLNPARIGIERIAQDSQGTVWMATTESGLLRFSSTGHYLGRYTSGNSALPSNQFTYLLYDARHNVLWASTRDVGVLKLRPTATSFQLLARYGYAQGKANSLRVNYVCPLLLDAQGSLWIGTIGGGCTS